MCQVTIKKDKRMDSGAARRRPPVSPLSTRVRTAPDLNFTSLSPEYIRMLQPVGFTPEGVAAGMMQDPIQHCCRQNGIAHHLSPVHDLLVRRKDERGSLIGVTDVFPQLCAASHKVVLASGEKGQFQAG